MACLFIGLFEVSSRCGRKDTHRVEWINFKNNLNRRIINNNNNCVLTSGDIMTLDGLVVTVMVLYQANGSNSVGSSCYGLVRCFGTNGEKYQTSDGLYTARDRSRRAANVIAVAARRRRRRRVASERLLLLLLLLSPEAAAIIAQSLVPSRTSRPRGSRPAVKRQRQLYSLVFLLTARHRRRRRPQGRPPDSAYALPPHANPIRCYFCVSSRVVCVFSETVFRSIASEQSSRQCSGRHAVTAEHHARLLSSNLALVTYSAETI